MIVAWLIAPRPLLAIRAEILQATGAVSVHVAGRFREPTGFQQSRDDHYFVFDRRAHTVYGLDDDLSSAWEIVQIGSEEGRIIDPTAFAVEPSGTLVVADAPNGRERIQIFSSAGFRAGANPDVGFYFVFQTGTPAFQKSDRQGRLIFERRIEGREIDPLIANLPTTPHIHVSDRDDDKVRRLQLRSTGLVAPNSLSFGRDRRLLVTPGLAEFAP